MKQINLLGRLCIKSSNPPRIPPGLGLAFGIIFASTASILVRYAQAEAPSLVIAAYRLTIATLVLTPVLLFRYRQDVMTMTQREIILTLSAGVFLAIHFAMWITSLEYTTVASSVVFVQTAPLFVALLSPLLLREPLTRIFFIGLALSLSGSLIIGLSDVCDWSGGLRCPPLSGFFVENAIKGNLLALGGAIAAAGYILVGRHIRRSVALIPYITLTYGTAAIALITLAIGAGHTFFSYHSQTYLYFLLLAIFPQLIAHTSYNWALRYLPAALVSISLLGEPICATVLAYFTLGETPPSLWLSGAVMILIGIALTTSRSYTTITTTNPGAVPR